MFHSQDILFTTLSSQVQSRQIDCIERGVSVGCAHQGFESGSPFKGGAMKHLRLLVTVVILCFASSFLSPALAQRKFPSKPLSRVQVLVWMDFGDESFRVVQLIGRAGIEPSPEYLSLIKNLRASPKLLETLGVTHPLGSPAIPTPGEEAVFAHISSCMTLAAKKQFADAEKECEAATSDEPQITYFALGNVRLKEGKYQAAVDAFRAAEKADPAIPDTHNYAGLGLGSLHDEKGSKREFDEAIRLDSDYDTPHNNVAGAFLAVNDLGTASREIREALRINPESGTAHNNLGVVLLR